MLKCHRCPEPADGGVLLTARGEPTGHDLERILLCPKCFRDFRKFLTHPEDPPAMVVDKQKVADRFVKKGRAQ